MSVETAAPKGSPESDLIARIEDRSARVGVIGLGYVGLPLVLLFEEAGFTVTGFDTDPAKIESLRRGESYIRHIGPAHVRDAFTRRATATAQFEELAECDVIVICVPTPLGKHREPDLKYVRITAETIASNVRRGQLIVLESTTYPGTTREELVPRLTRSSGLSCGSDFFIAFSPEREDPGNERFNTRNIPKVVGGIDEASLRVAVAFYAAAIQHVVPVSSAEVAESAKLLENIFRAVNIALVNELKVVFQRMDIDIWEVIDAAKTKPFGYMPFYPGPGLGGHCIPLDPFYLTWKAAEYGLWARFIELAGEINTSMPRYVVSRVADAINEQGKSVVGARVLVLGLSYKADIDDDRESPSFEIIELLEERRAIVSYCDPYIPTARPGRKHDIGMVSVPCTSEEFSRYDAIVVSTAHTQFKDADLYAGAQLVIDTRNIVPAAGVAGRLVKA